MKILASILFIVPSMLFGQTQNSFMPGKWEVLEVDNLAYHYNTQTDSLRHTPVALGRYYMRFQSLGLEDFKAFVAKFEKEMRQTEHFVFSPDGSYERYKAGELINLGTYEVDTNAQLIKLSFKFVGPSEEDGEIEERPLVNKEWNYEYSAENQRLIFKFGLHLPTPTTYVLRKV